MGHSNQWMNKARLNVLTLETRVTPGSLLNSGLGLSGLEDVLPRPQVVESSDVIIARKLEDTQAQNVVSAPQANEAQVSQAQIGSPSTVNQTSTGDLSVGNVAQTTPAVNNPAVYAPAKAAAASETITAPTSQNSQPGSDIRTVDAKMKQHKMVPATRHNVAGIQQGAPATSVTTPCRETAGEAFNPQWGSYQGTAGTDAVNDVATGKGPTTGTTYAAGNEGATGVIRTYANATGACGISVTEAAATFTGIAINTKGVYATYNKNDGSESGIIQFNSSLVEQNRTIVLQPAGGAVEFNGVGISPNGANSDVYVAGRYNDPSLSSYSLGIELRLDDANINTAVFFNVVDYGGDGETTGVAADRPNNSYFGGRFDGSTSLGLGDLALTYRLNGAGTSAPWAFYWSDGFTVQFDSRIGARGVKFVGGTTAAGGIYFGGTTDNLGLAQPTSVASLWLKLNELDGNASDLDTWAIGAYSGNLGDLGTNDVAADRGSGAGNANANYASYRSSDDGSTADLNNKGRLYRWDLLIDNVVYQANYGTTGDNFNYEFNGVDVRTTSPTDSVSVGGLTNSTAALAGPGCDLTANGGQDGLVLSYTQP
jgi:hypothetical protein